MFLDPHVESYILLFHILMDLIGFGLFAYLTHNYHTTLNKTGLFFFTYFIIADFSHLVFSHQLLNNTHVILELGISYSWTIFKAALVYFGILTIQDHKVLQLKKD